MPLLDDMLITKLSRTPFIRLLVRLAMPLGWLLPFRNRSALFFFFPFLHVGGAERVHAALIGCVADKRPWVFFTKRSDNQRFRPLFSARARLFNIWFLLKHGYPFSIGIMAGLINRHKRPVVFGSNSLFYYLLLPHLRQGVRRLDLLHAFGGGTEEFSLPAVPVLDARVLITSRTREDLATQYRDRGIDPNLLERVVLIPNGVEVPPSPPRRKREGKLRILYVGRASEEKRVHLVGSIAAACSQRGLAVSVTLVGDIAPETLGEGAARSCIFSGEIHDREKMDRLYATADLLLLTSSREGFPLVIMEAMAHGVVPLSTAVGGIPEHLHHGENGWLIGNHDDQELIVESACSLIAQACSDPQRLETMSQAAHEYAAAHFSSARFCEAYRRILAPGGYDAHA
ncbi:glycosyltransferase family 4 protein [Pelobacter propionicus]|uniref:Glycosyl transferase, group 1 n=1 Tax=Pelobacter propionicus (strain DSM 2379 / NBRC 103807 / OttBd1) TaxID=338966 RepID=A1ANW7_PELPD|nr:glycosyltransferase family 4 protein [Pelobacter propionicus]ABK99037.1 glycosyl transferase, group 1 [Pelobacter propionicus DSM 2379]